MNVLVSLYDRYIGFVFFVTLVTVFIFQDTGTGIPPELEGRLFEVFATAGKEEGTGLGLAIVHKIVKEHNGEITYNTSPEGTAFTITLPLERSIASEFQVASASRS